MIKIYETDSFRRELSSVVTSCIQENGRIYIQLSETIFFPEEGGQYADTGVLVPVSSAADDAPVHVLDGEYRRGDIRYVVDREIVPGTEVLCILDWEKRFSRMQQHTGEHILTGMIHNRYGYNNVGFHLSDDSPVTLDVSGPLTWEQAMEMEQAANEVVFANVPVRVLFPSREELSRLDYRSKIEIEGQVRLIAIGEGSKPVDLCACCAPHVARTGEIGIIKIISMQKYKGGTRLGILCGGRALAHYRQEWHRLDSLARYLSTGVDQVADSVKGLQAELAAAKEKAAALTETALLRELEAIPSDAPALVFTKEDLPPVVVKNTFNALAERFPARYVGLFIGSDDAGYRYAAGSKDLDARKLAGFMREALAAKGGGSQDMIQGKVSAGQEEILQFWRTL